MATPSPQGCRITRCTAEVPPTLAAQSVCLNHFLDQSFTRADFALQRSDRGEPIDHATLDWLVADAHITLSALAESTAQQADLEQRSRILELLLCIANLTEYTANHPIQIPAQA
jgi:hypothetical protein